MTEPISILQQRLDLLRARVRAALPTSPDLADVCGEIAQCKAELRTLGAVVADQPEDLLGRNGATASPTSGITWLGSTIGVIRHLCDAQDWPALWELLDADNYVAVRLRHDPSMHSLIQDLDLIRQQIAATTHGDEQTQVVWLPHLWRYSLLRGSLAGLADTYPPHLIILLAELGEVQEAISLADMLTEPEHRIAMLIQIGSVQAKQGQPEEAQQLWQRATGLIRSIHSAWLQRHLSKQLEVAQTATRSAVPPAAATSDQQAAPISTSELALALEQARKLKPADQRSIALQELAIPLARAGQPEAAAGVARMIEDARLRAWSLAAIAGAWVRASKVETGRLYAAEAIKMVRSLELVNSNAQALRLMAMRLVQAGQLESALLAARALKETEPCDRAQRLVAELLAQAGQGDQALACAQAVKHIHERVWTLKAVANSLVRAGQIEQALKAARALEVAYERADVLCNVVAARASAGHIQHALVCAEEVAETAQRVPDARLGGLVLRKVALTLANAGIEAASQMYGKQAEDLVRSIEQAGERARGLAEQAQMLADAGQITQALVLLDPNDDSYWHTQALEAIAKAWARAGQPDATLAITRSLKEPAGRARMLGSVAAALSQAGLDQATHSCIAELIAVALTVEHPSERASVLGSAVWALAGAGQPELAVEIAHLIEQGNERARAFAAVVAALAQAGHSEPALALARSIGQPGIRIKALVSTAEAQAKAGNLEAARTIADEALADLALVESRERGECLHTIAAALAQGDNPAVVLAFLYDHWPRLAHRDDLIALLPAATPLIIAYPFLAEELLNGFGWVERVMKQW